MVQVRATYPRLADGTLDRDAWIAQLPGFEDESDARRMQRACALSQASQREASDNKSPIGCFDAGLEMARILADLHMDEDALIAAVIYRAVREARVEHAQVVEDLGDTVGKLVEGVLRMAAISQSRTETRPVLGQGNPQVDNMRKMLVAMVDDVRVGLIKLAERTQAIRAVKNHPDKNKQQRVAREVFDIYAPLAHRLGIGHIKWELEDLSFRYLEPDDYNTIAKLLDGKRLDRQEYIERVVNELSGELSKAGIDAEVNGRAKHIYSIWRKMRRKGVSFDQVYDIRALRIMVPQLKDCYASLGIVHSLWRNIAREFDDYIANPKDNGYRSLHTAVIGPDAKVIEVQIRTFDMHEEAELGVCAHWLYKGTDTRNRSTGYEEKLEWLRQVLEWHEETGGNVDIGEFAGELTQDFGSDRIYLFTPEGDVVDVAFGSTPVDFAYHIHTEVGHRCRGAKVDGRIVPLSTVLRNGQKVEILTGSEAAPNRDWLRGTLGFINSSRARSKVRAWFKKQARGENIAAGRSLLERELKRMALTSVDYKVLAEKLHYASVDDMYAALGAGDVSASQVMRIAESMFGDSLQTNVVAPLTRKTADSGGHSIMVRGVGNLLTQIANCCKPVPGDDIVGYVTVQRGVTIHRKDCAHFLQSSSRNNERVIEVDWGQEEEGRYAVDIVIEAYDRTGLLSDISGMLALLHVNVTNLNTHSDKQTSTAIMRFTLEVRSIEDLVRVLARLNNLPNVISAERVS